MNPRKYSIRHKLDIAEFYADDKGGYVIELRKNKASIWTPTGVEYLSYYVLDAYRHKSQVQAQECRNRIGAAFERLMSKVKVNNPYMEIIENARN